VALQEEIGRQGSIVMDGRDIGTVVMPDADWKIFLQATCGGKGSDGARRNFSAEGPLDLVELQEQIRAAGSL
jgi:cytidylate kinase